MEDAGILLSTLTQNTPGTVRGEKFLLTLVTIGCMPVPDPRRIAMNAELKRFSPGKIWSDILTGFHKLD
jgi:hypothetical protein